MTALGLLFRREMALAWGRGGGPTVALAFLAAATMALPLAAGPSPAGLAGIAGGAAFVSLVLASLLSLDRLFERDFEDGSLELLALGPLPLEAVGAVKCVALWSAIGVPLALAAPLAAMALGAPARAAAMIAATSALGALAFAFVGGAGAALALASRRGGVLIAVIVLPLVIPPVIFGGTAIWAFTARLPWTTAVALLGAYSLAAVGLAPFAMAAACRNALS
jgi:heme exporter protein B